MLYKVEMRSVSVCTETGNIVPAKVSYIKKSCVRGYRAPYTTFKNVARSTAAYFELEAIIVNLVQNVKLSAFREMFV